MKNISIFFAALVAVLFSVADTNAQITPPYYNPANVNITGGAINGTTVGATTAAAGSFTSLSSTSALLSGYTQINNSQSTWLTAFNTPSIYGSASSGSAPFNESGNLIISPRISGAARDVIISTQASTSNFLFDRNGKFQVGSGSTTSAGLIAGYLGTSGFGAIWSTGVTPSSTNYSFASNGAITAFSGSTNANLNVNSVARVSANTTGVTFAGDMIYDKKIAAPGTTGAQTINKTTGRVNFAAAATSLVVTNSLATANSICHVTKATNDATMRLGACVAAAGSITIYADVAPAAETAVNFTVTN